MDEKPHGSDAGNSPNPENGIEAARREIEAAGGPISKQTETESPTGAPGDNRLATLPNISGYSIEAPIRRGGQGVVYKALHNATGRQVAIKVMKEGPFASDEDRARFDREVRILAQLNHPNIITIHDVGTVNGTYYFIMDFVDGEPLDGFITESEPPVEAILELFAKICEAVNAAHRQGIIHRDLKPGNILVTADGEPRILDFGLAKHATGADDGVHTLTGHFIGSLPWASPEQAVGDSSEIDVRTDVYSLGVLAYHMLTRGFPYDVVGNMRDVLDRIAHAVPARPSSARERLDHDVETIVLKCLAKERDRRYETAGELARDVRHYLAREPIEAKRDSAWYVLTKTMRRYRMRVAAAAMFVLLIAASTIALSIMYQRQSESLTIERELTAQLKEERDRAETALQMQRRERERAEVARTVADREAQRSERQAYCSKIALARAALNQGDIGRVHNLLQEAASGLRGWEWYRLNWLADRSVLTILHDGTVWGITPSPDGKVVASAGRYGVVKIWDAASGREMRSLKGHTEEATCVVYSPDGHLLATGSEDHTVRIWDAKTGAEQLVYRGHDEDVTNVAFSPDGQRVLSVQRHGAMRIWEPATGQNITAIDFQHGSGGGMPVVFSADGTQIIGGSWQKLILFNAQSGEITNEFQAHEGDGYISDLARTSDGTRIVSLASKSVTVWDTQTWEPIAVLGNPDGPNRFGRAVAISDDGREVVVASQAKRIERWDVATNTKRSSLPGHTSTIEDLAVLPGSNTAVSVDSAIKFWSAGRIGSWPHSGRSRARSFHVCGQLGRITRRYRRQRRHIRELRACLGSCLNERDVRCGAARPGGVASRIQPRR
jgi:tRNA A-37 threonylcarbamoyl transferase component Bud32